jgi:hypothetical protein
MFEDPTAVAVVSEIVLQGNVPIVEEGADALLGGEEYIAWILASFAGGLFGAAIGALPAFVFTGIMVIAGEMLGLTGNDAVTGLVAFGPVFGPHISFAAGAAATAYAAKKGYMDDQDWGYHKAKNILTAFGTHRTDVLIVGGLFGVLGFVITHVSGGLLALPWDPIAMGVVLSAVAHRLAFGYSMFSSMNYGDGQFDVTPFEREDMHTEFSDSEVMGGAPDERLNKEPWLPWMYEWVGVVLIGVGAGALGGWLFWATGSPFLGFGISAASLFFLNLGFDGNIGDLYITVPVTHHITLPASTAPMAFAGVEYGVAQSANLSMAVAVVIGAVFGLLGALFGEFWQRVFYMNADTHFDPPAASIVTTTFIIGVLGIVGIFESAAWVPVPA